MLEFFVVLPLNIDDDDKRDPFIFQVVNLNQDSDDISFHSHLTVTLTTPITFNILLPSVVHTELERYVIVYFQMPLFFTNFNFRTSLKHFMISATPLSFKL